MQKQTNYIAKPVDKNGFAIYTPEENSIWAILMERQLKIIQERACDEFILGLEKLNLPRTRIPQCPEVSEILKNTTGWTLEPVAALISFEYFFNLLANKKFPVATFIRNKQDLDYIQEPDIFHEIFGHCPLLTNPAYAEFTHTYGKLGLAATPKERIMLARLFWFTVEFGLIQTNKGLRAYGGGILSSISETVYCLESNLPERKIFNEVEVLKTDYRIDQIQNKYFILENFEQLYELIKIDLIALIHNLNNSNIHKPQHAC